MTVNNNPAPITGMTTVCAGFATNLYSGPSGGVWSQGSGSYTYGNINPVTGVVSGITAGFIPVTYSLGSGCRAVDTVEVINLPAVIGGTANVTYLLFTGCKSIAQMTVNSTPAPITGNPHICGGNYCYGGTGLHVNLSGSQPGVSYELYYGSSATGYLAGSGFPLDFGLHTPGGVYTVQATNVTSGLNLRMTSNYRCRTVDTLTGGDTVNGILVPGATSETYTAIFGDYDSISVQVISSGVCHNIGTVDWFFIGVAPLSTSQAATTISDLRLVPNPNKGTFTISGNLSTGGDEDVNAEVTDMLGQVVFRGVVKAKGGRIESRITLENNLANGMYLLTLRTDAEQKVFHFVMEQ
eukprot:gene34288-biopygen5254